MGATRKKASRGHEPEGGKERGVSVAHPRGREGLTERESSASRMQEEPAGLRGRKTGNRDPIFSAFLHYGIMYVCIYTHTYILCI